MVYQILGGVNGPGSVPGPGGTWSWGNKNGPGEIVPGPRGFTWLGVYLVGGCIWSGGWT